MTFFAGIDVGAKHVHCAAVDADARVVDGCLLEGNEHAELAAWARRALVIAIDAPAAPSTAPHREDPDLPPKFQSARCAEIELGRSFGVWVPWTTPTGPHFPGWMETGFSTYRALAAATEGELIEVYPHAGFRRLAAGEPLPKKTTAAGVRTRAALLRAAGVYAEHLGLWPHDSLDAALAALIALQRHAGNAVRVGCGHDDSAIWLPSE